MSARTEEVAKRFFQKISNDPQWDYTDHKAKPLVLAAFELYARAWGGNGWDIRRWEWPFTQLNEKGKFVGDEPWTVLLRHAIGLCKSKHARAA